MVQNSPLFNGSFKFINIAFIVFFMLLFSSCGFQKEVLLTGKTMGTTYHIKVVIGYFEDSNELKDRIEQKLKEINHSMSTFIRDSEISKFNALRRSGEKFYISNDFFHVVTVAEKLFRLTGGAWDGTIKPLVDLWGFGKSNIPNKIPSEKEIKNAWLNTGFHHIDISANRYLVKKQGSISLDLASIAKGFAVDQMATIIQKYGIQNFLVEIGGDGYASGLRNDGKPWKIGINQPHPDAPADQVYKVLTLQNKAFATSGDYRNFFERNGKRFSHILDPRNGFPVSNGVVSVSILADTCTFADGLATAVMVLGPEEGLALVNRIDNTECLIIVRKNDDTLVDYYSKGLRPDA
ncbi:MAG: FAD:protein FMN transferase [Desulfobacterales bacterium]|nr:MAG: FAD:protein FMN transferase [Desulfobacterales bacterium]